MSNHTPGPWKVSRRFDVYQDTQTPGVGGTFIATTKGVSELPESVNQVCEADAKLIAVTPELADALRELHDFSAVPFYFHGADLKRSAAAFDKAAELLRRIGK
jgi:hypothetical protein